MKDKKDDVSAACNDYLKILGLVAIAHAWIKVLEVSFQDYENNKDFYEDKIQTAHFYFKRVFRLLQSWESKNLTKRHQYFGNKDNFQTVEGLEFYSDAKSRFNRKFNKKTTTRLTDRPLIFTGIREKSEIRRSFDPVATAKEFFFSVINLLVANFVAILWPEVY